MIATKHIDSSHPYAEGILCDMFASWCDQNGMPDEGDAYEILVGRWDTLTTVQREWLQDFIKVWERDVEGKDL